MLFLPITAFVFGYLFYEFHWKRRNLPPGPLPLPFIGNLHTIEKHSPGYEAYQMWAREYGPVYTFWIGDVPMIAITDYNIIKETVIKEGEKYTGRYILPGWLLFRGGYYGVADIGGDKWREQRRFSIHTLREFGMGKNIMEERVQIEVDSLLERLESQKTVQPQKEIDLAVGSIINSLMFGYRFDEDNVSEFHFLKSTMTRLFTDFNTGWGEVMLVYPVLRHLPFFNKMWASYWGYRENLFGFFRKQIKNRREHLDFESQVTADFVENFLKAQHKNRDEEDQGGYTDMQLINLVFDLWSAGMETTSNTLTWGIIYLLNYPEVQEKIHKELDDVIKSDRRITQEDRSSLPYMGAFICEVQRLGNIVPLNIPRQITEDVNINGYSVPKGTFMMPQICCVLYDEKIFPGPHAFRPERFLSKEGTLLRIEELIPFSVGKRACLGEGLAKLELFLFAANLLQMFKITSATKPSMLKTSGFIMTPQPFSCEFTDRRR